MHCKHCGNKIDNDSSFCSFCGGRIEPIGQSTQTQQPINIPISQEFESLKISKTINENLAIQDRGLLISFIVIVSIRLFWFISDLINKGKSYSDMEQYINYVIKPSYVIFWSFPLLLALFSKRKEQRLIMIIVGMLIVGLSVYENFFKSI